MSNFSCVKCGGSWIDMGAMGYNTLCKHTMEEAMTAPATPRTDALHFDWKDGIDMQRHELLKLSRALERELAQVTAERDDYGNRLDRLADSHALTLKCYEEAEAENAELLALLEEIKGRVQFGTSTHMSSDIVKMCDAALKEGK